MNMSMKVPLNKKEIQSDYDKDSSFNKSQGRIQIKHLSNLFNGTIKMKEYSKKNGHSHTYTHLNDLESDQYSEIDSNFSVKNQKVHRVRHSKSPTKERHIEHNNTSYAEESYKVSHLNRIHIRERDLSEGKGKKVSSFESKYLL